MNLLRQYPLVKASMKLVGDARQRGSAPHTGLRTMAGTGAPADRHHPHTPDNRIRADLDAGGR